jgi:hypothetical protein
MHMQPSEGDNAAIDASSRSKRWNREESVTVMQGTWSRRRWIWSWIFLSLWIFETLKRMLCTKAFLSFPVSNYQKTRKVKANPYEVLRKQTHPMAPEAMQQGRKEVSRETRETKGRHAIAPVYMTINRKNSVEEKRWWEKEVCGMQKQENAFVIKCQSFLHW